MPTIERICGYRFELYYLFYDLVTLEKLNPPLVQWMPYPNDPPTTETLGEWWNWYVGNCEQWHATKELAAQALGMSLRSYFGGCGLEVPE